ncbi:hypothetical protein THRCLA_21138 [Thraustotheca clavata]|uniref:Secreted protein n=1 Tax=Thraustotheca clavata TaxID=74557 RepID=A0A1V9ZZU3_9STRA|nr:hypothetical protein THRCLA_21138 [Thraustotheca clavata]
MIQLQCLILSLVFSTASAQLLTGENALYLVPIMIAMPLILGMAFFFVFSKLCKTEQEKLEENIVMGVPVVVFVEEGRKSSATTNDESSYVTGMTPVAELAEDYENHSSVYASTTTPSCSAS